MRDPRNWVRPVAAAASSAPAAGTALVVLRVRASSTSAAARSRTDLLDLAERTLRDVGREARAPARPDDPIGPARA